MHSDRTRLALTDIRDNLLLARDFVSNLGAEEFKADRRTFYAVTRALEIVSEASRRLPAELRARHPALPWPAIMGSGNIYRHEYDAVAETRVWQTVHASLAPLLAAVDSELAQCDEGTGDTPSFHPPLA